MTGDLIQDDSSQAYERFCELMTPLGLPVHCVPGNHDVRELMQDAVSMPPFYYCDSLKIGGWLIVGIDSCLDGEAGGFVCEEEMTRLQQVIDANDAAFVLVCLHHPPLPLGSNWLDQVGLRNGDEFLTFIGNNQKVRAAIFGHAHQEFDGERNGIRIIGTPSTCRQFKPGCDKFALDDQPPAYRRISLQGDGSVTTKLIWLADEGP
jgi:Icc protein